MKNIKLIYLFNIFSTPTFWFATLIPYLTKYKSFTEVQALSAVGTFSLMVLLFEVPTGVIADKVSRKLSLYLGGLSNMIAMIFFINGK
ncbi:MAG: hypothetical protein Q9M91_01035 [Candidatus Dojkabacteria bacterium]|nr:hypothetical protein [Candidatus Dojkabacteria bacterium]MDQ7020411.1 hypothetical protein [Candidatus Dojkabacteria bacterium]